MDRLAIGRHAEECAARALQRQGAEILLRNYRRRCGELDIVAREGAELVIVEVRLRASDDFGGAAASVTGLKQARIVRTARQLLQQQRTLAGLRVRFDVAVVRPTSGDNWPVEWIRHAFDCPG